MIGIGMSHGQKALENKLTMPLPCWQYTGEGGKGFKVEM